MNEEKYALKIKNLSKKFKDFELKNISLNLPQGSIMGIVGENGAGKSTTIKAILDIIHADSGEIEILGCVDGAKFCDVKEQIGVVMDETMFHDAFNVKNINSFMKSIYKTWSEEKFESYIKEFDLPKNKIIKEYSRGMKMKLGIAVALSHDSKILILDEATSGLDPIVRDEILNIFINYIQDETKSIFVSSHIISDLEKICDYIAFIHKGKLVFCEEKDFLLEKYGILKCSNEEFKNIDKNIIVSYKENKFGIEALVLKKEANNLSNIDNAGIEDIMLYIVKGEK